MIKCIKIQNHIHYQTIRRNLIYGKMAGYIIGPLFSIKGILLGIDELWQCVAAA